MCFLTISVYYGERGGEEGCLVQLERACRGRILNFYPNLHEKSKNRNTDCINNLYYKYMWNMDLKVAPKVFLHVINGLN